MTREITTFSFPCPTVPQWSIWADYHHDTSILILTCPVDAQDTLGESPEDRMTLFRLEDWCAEWEGEYFTWKDVLDILKGAGVPTIYVESDRGTSPVSTINYPCHHCGCDLHWPRPSGVCSEACLRLLQERY